MAENLRALCLETYREFVKTFPMPEEFRKWLRVNERHPRMIDNLVCDLSRVPHAKKENIQMAVRDVTRWFITASMLKAEQRHMSKLAKMTIQKKADEEEAFRKDVDTLDREGFSGVLQKSESEEVEKIRSDVGLTQKELDELPAYPAERNVQEQSP
jgi:hypothetical protein